MDECEHLCNRLAIMTNGQLKCIGPIQRLKDTFALGFLITIMLKSDQSAENVHLVKKSMTASFQCSLREEYGGKLNYVIQATDLKWSVIFEKVQSIRKQYASIIDDISVNESSLEDIFLKIARESMSSTAVIENDNDSSV